MPTVLTGCCVCVMNPTEEAECKVVGSLAHSSMHKVHIHIILYVYIVLYYMYYMSKMCFT